MFIDHSYQEFEFLKAVAASITLTLPPETLEGVAQNMVLLKNYAASLEEIDLPDECGPAGDYVP